jgi:hypothetical protein
MMKSTFALLILNSILLASTALASDRHYSGGASFSTAHCRYEGGMQLTVDDKGKVTGKYHLGKPQKAEIPVAGQLSADGKQLSFSAGELSFSSSSTSRALEASQGIFYGGASASGKSPALGKCPSEAPTPGKSSWGGYLK